MVLIERWEVGSSNSIGTCVPFAVNCRIDLSLHIDKMYMLLLNAILFGWMQMKNYGQWDIRAMGFRSKTEAIIYNICRLQIHITKRVLARYQVERLQCPNELRKFYTVYHT